MGVKIAVIFFLAITAYTSAFPASTSDTELIDPKYGDQPIVDTGVISAGGTGGFFNGPFDIFQSMDSMMKRMREQMNALLNRFGSSNGTSITNVDDFTGFGFPSLPDLDLGKGNTTSVTKIINGQKVIINETKYSNENENGGSFFKVRVIEVKPEKPDQEDIPTTNVAPRDIESVENTRDNEIPKKAETEAARYGKLEPLEAFENTLPKNVAPLYNRWNDLEDFDAENRIDGPLVQPMKPYDLNRDIYVNKILAHRRYPHNPDAEFIFNNNYYEPKSHDLSGDIRVNQLMADQGVTPNPNAEVFIPRYTREFEKYINPR